MTAVLEIEELIEKPVLKISRNINSYRLSNTEIAIIGTRDPSVEQAEVAYNVAWQLSHYCGIGIRTGGAGGVDDQAMKGAAPGLLTVCVPWPDYNRHIVPHHAKVIVYNRLKHPTWTESVAKYHPFPNKLTTGAFKLMARNYGIIEGSKAVLALPNSKGMGGTLQGITIARNLGIPLWSFSKGNSIPDNLIYHLKSLLI
jgi:predicted Rossmann-fold nucleotide-binding protein